jgi:hypothetical protein
VQGQRKIASTVSTLKSQLESNNNNSNNNSNRGRNGNNRGRDRNNNDRRSRAGRGGRGGARGNYKYCWTHGNCSHSGTDCETPADGHIKEASYANMQEGSTTRCHWLPS